MDIEVIRANYEAAHAELTACFCEGKPFKDEVLTKERFQQLHSQLWDDYQKQALQIGDPKTLKEIYDIFQARFMNVFVRHYIDKKTTKAELAAEYAALYREGSDILIKAGYLKEQPTNAFVLQMFTMTDDAWQASGGDIEKVINACRATTSYARTEGVKQFGKRD